MRLAETVWQAANLLLPLSVDLDPIFVRVFNEEAVPAISFEIFVNHSSLALKALNDSLECGEGPHLEREMVKSAAPPNGRILVPVELKLIPP